MLSSGRKISRAKKLANFCTIGVVFSSSYGYSAENDSPDNSDKTIIVTGTINDYSVQSTNAATKLNLATKETPQSVTVITPSRIKDQDLKTIGDVLKNTTRVSENSYDSDRFDYWSRGYRIDNFSYDGLPTATGSVSSFLDASLDMSIYDHVNVVRGATGLLTGVGNPSASVDLIRKHAVSKNFERTANLGGGTWDNYRGSVDISTPLTEDGSVRGRFITTLQTTDLQLNRYNKKNKLFYGVIDADLSPNTLLSIGYDYQDARPGAPTFGGFYFFDSAGKKINWSRKFNSAPNWAKWDVNTNNAFVTLDHFFSNDWEFKINGEYSETKTHEKLASFAGAPDAETGSVTYEAIKNVENRKVYSVDAFARGPFELFNHEHELVIGISASRQRTNSLSSSWNYFTVDNIYNFNGSVSEPDWGSLSDQGTNRTYQRAIYATTRFNLTDDLKFILGGRFSDWRVTGSDDNNKSKFIPYTGVFYNLNDTFTLYSSYTGIFNPQTYRDKNVAYLQPQIGKSYEAGVKASSFDDRLNTSLSVFKTTQSNFAEVDGQSYVLGTFEQAYKAASDTTSRGFEIEASGALTDRWNLSAGFTHYVMHASSNEAVNTDIPRTTIKMFTSYKAPVLQDKLNFGGGVRWQNGTYKDITSNTTTERVKQEAYTLVDLYARYDILPNVTAQVNVNNVFDKNTIAF
ncbi:TonB-dependent siderophore receptor [Enterobacter hormaechei]|uniref:TonB-dependent siderophore receptor n=1 Tax=Enterobacter ludwigii TaxID=299767 RepID=A0AAX3LJ01_9ENTR|nr:MULTISPECIES: TonB-dependent siderophore receptor [Enterobacter]MCW4756579.1 TonB-dependent siderophore receptor [Enterobacter hormaechei]WCE15993.1 TonB-dependent siderophore receptor [Enterobacter ludwigii]